MCGAYASGIAVSGASSGSQLMRERMFMLSEKEKARLAPGFLNLITKTKGSNY